VARPAAERRLQAKLPPTVRRAREDRERPPPVKRPPRISCPTPSEGPWKAVQRVARRARCSR
jgi:hypothetical protein